MSPLAEESCGHGLLTPVSAAGVLPMVVEGLSKKMVEIAKNPANAR